MCSCSALVAEYVRELSELRPLFRYDEHISMTGRQKTKQILFEDERNAGIIRKHLGLNLLFIAGDLDFVAKGSLLTSFKSCRVSLSHVY